MVFLKNSQSQDLAGQPQLSPGPGGTQLEAVWDKGEPKDSALGW